MTAPASRLSERDAWAIALAWREQLQGCVRLEIDADATFRMVESFEWVTFVLHGAKDDGFAEVIEPIDTARCARAASIAWFALSCCCGFGGTENPRFWRRVFSELHAPKDHRVIFRRPRAQIHITDAVRFFDHADRPFPRVLIEPHATDQDACLRAFFGSRIESPPEDEPSPLDAMMQKLGSFFSGTRTQRRLSVRDLDSLLKAHSSRLDAILTQLRPFIRATHWKRRLPVAIRGVDAKHLAWMLPSLTIPDKRQGLQLQQMQLETVYLRDDETHLDTAVKTLLTRTKIQVCLPKLALSRLSPGLEDQFRPLVLPADENQSPRVRIGVLTTVFPRGAKFASLCSSLPHTRAITTVQLDATSRHIATIVGLRAIEWAWLGYAIFHPDATEESTFAHLDLDQYRMIDRELDFLKKMAKGNNLLGGYDTNLCSPYLSECYQQGRVRAGTAVYHSPQDDATLIVTYPTETWVSLCMASAHLSSLKHWECVVAPGLGLGWIRKKQLLEIVSRPPGPSCLRGLRVNIESAFGGHGPMLQLLSIVGERLDDLQIIGRRSPLNAATVSAIMKLCPTLKSLRICHDGSAWSELESSSPAAPASALQELELVVGSYQHLPVLTPLRSPRLNKLRALRVITLAKTSFLSNRRTFVDILDRYPQLQYANWSLGWTHTGSSPLRSYDEHQQASLARFEGYKSDVDEFVYLPMPMACRFGFLSVVQHETVSPRSSLHNLGRDVIRIIIAFATYRTRRELYVDDEVEFVTGHVRN